MDQFLQIVAREYKTRYADTSKLTFVMPNKRSGTFLLKAFSDLHDTPAIAPRIMPITDFVSEVSDHVADSRIDLLFRIFKCYKRLEGADGKMTFDRFSSWGETIMTDFNEIDMQMVKPEEIFKNVYDLNTIRSNFLSPRQKRVMVEYFGYTPEIIEEKFETLWKKFEVFSERDGEESGKLKHKFHSLWQILSPLYYDLKSDLESEGLTTNGGVYREAVEKVEAGYEPYPDSKLVFVGFNALSEAENRLFRALKEMEFDMGDGPEPKADFVWDKISTSLENVDGPAGRFIRINSAAENFPSPEWLAPVLERLRDSFCRDITVEAVPSNIMQTKEAGKWLSLFHKGGDDKALEKARIAVILPDENLLVPLLYSLPEGCTKPNLTMGFPLKQTPVIGFASLLRRLQQGAARTGRNGVFFLSDVKDLLGHPYSRILFNRNKSDHLIKDCEKERRIVVTESTLKKLGKNAALIFRTFDAGTPSALIIKYLMDILRKVRQMVEVRNADTFIRSKIEKVYISTYVDALIRLENCLADYDFNLTPEDVFMLADRMLAGETVVFEGKPLEGLQVMGVLETRCIDFDKIIMLSVNEKMMPRVGRNASFIPNIVRVAFGMPPANYQEELFAYYFYRLLSRCSQAVLTYDSRASENRTPGPSRYLLQLKYLAEGIELKETDISFGMPSPLKGDMRIEKSPEIMKFLDRYRVEEGTSEKSKEIKNFSASSLRNYFGCQVKFLYGNVLGLQLEKEKLETIDAADLGTVVHKTIERLYFPEDMRGRMLDKPIVKTRAEIEALLEEKGSDIRETTIEAAARRSILEVHFDVEEENSNNGELRGSAAIIMEHIVTYVKYILGEDLGRAPFRLWGSEIRHELDYPLTSGAKVRMKMIIDRLDQEGVERPDAPFRVVDYKTGAAHIEAKEFEDIFTGDFRAANLFQLIFYAELLLRAFEKNDKLHLPAGISLEEFEKNLKLVIYEVTKLPLKKGVVSPKIGKTVDREGKEKGRQIKTMGEFRTIEKEEGVRFMEILEDTLERILDDKTPFEGFPDEATCRFCDFKLRCDMQRAAREDAEAKKEG